MGAIEVQGLAWKRPGSGHRLFHDVPAVRDRVKASPSVVATDLSAMPATDRLDLILTAVRREAADVLGLDTIGAVCDVLFDEFRERRFARPPLLRKMLSAGWYGRKSGMGFYDYSGEKPVPNPGI